MSVGTRLRRLRLQRGLTQKELADPRYTHAYVSTIEAGRRTPSPTALEHFAKKLSVDVEELRTGRPPDLEAKLNLKLQEARKDISAGAFDDAGRALAQVLKDSKRYKMTHLEAKATEYQALIDERRGNAQAAFERYQDVEKILIEAPPPLLADCVAGQARCLTDIGDVRYAIYLIESLVDRLDREGYSDPNALVRLYAPLVRAYVQLGVHSKATEYAEAALSMLPEVDDPFNQAVMHVNLAAAYLRDGRSKEADESLLRAEDLFRNLDLRAESATAHLNRGFSLVRGGGDLEVAKSELETARELFVSMKNTRLEAYALNELAHVARVEGDLETARRHLDRSLSILKNSEDVGELALAHLELGLCIQEEDAKRAEKHLRKAVDLFTKAEQFLRAARAHRVLGDMLIEQGREDEACKVFRAGLWVLENFECP
ncbi:MAG TPA: helix-turn-helix domain-containing protein [Actinomycetota bacterium]|nr:helix-turn-helix domain-containing protein [Actinomycetota bacterium]